MGKMPLVVHAWDIPRKTQEDTDFLKHAGAEGMGSKAGLTALLAGTVGTSVMEMSRTAGAPSIHDAKICDLRDQVLGAVRIIVALKVTGFTARLSEEMSPQTLREIVAERNRSYEQMLSRAEPHKSGERPLERPIIFGVTELSSISIRRAEFEARLLRNAEMMGNVGFDGAVVPAGFLEPLKTRFPALKTLVVGVRPFPEARIWRDDQRYPLTHLEAAALGGDILVIGRPISTAEDRHAAVSRIMGDLRAQAART